MLYRDAIIADRACFSNSIMICLHPISIPLQLWYQSHYSPPHLHDPHRILPASTPHTLQETILLRQPIDTVVALAHGAHKAAQRIDLVLASVAAVLVDFADGDLYRRVVFGFDDAVRGAAFARDVAVKEKRGLVDVGR